MAKSTTVSHDRDPELEFMRAVRREFAPLLRQAGLSEVRAQTTFVEFEGRGVFVNIVHGRSSFEIRVEIGLTSSPELGRIGLMDWIGALGGDVKRGCYSASTAERVGIGVRSVAQAFEEFAVSRIQSREEVLFVMNLAWARSAERGRVREREYIRAQAELAWREKRLEAAIRLYRQLPPEDLTALDMKRLARAERLIQEKGDEIR